MHMSMLQPLCVSLVLLVPALVHAATLENPSHGSFYSGIGVVSGWKCTATGPLTVRFNGSDPISLAYGNERPDVREAGACPRAQVGFVSIMNWAELGDGTHTAVVYDDGVEFARSTFTVATTGEPFVRGAEGECRVEDFPAPGERMHFEWNQNTQHLEMVSARGEDDTPEAGARTPPPPAGSGGRSGPATLENPSDGSFYSGIGVVSGWKCTATGPLTVRFNGGAPLPLAYGNARPDVPEAGACPRAHVGFVSIMNWAELGDGTHTAVVYDDGVEFARNTFTVATTGEPFVRRAKGGCRVPDFPAPGERMHFEWNQNTQHLEMVSDRRGICGRTPQVRSAILRSLSRTDCEGVTLADLVTIVYLDIRNSSLSSLKAGDFAGLVNLESLWLMWNDLTTLPPGLFAGLVNLESLWLYVNQLTTLPPGLFAGLGNLEVLLLGCNQLTTLPPGLFAGLTSLEQLSLHTNQLTTLPPGLFAGLGNLRGLWLAHNQLTTLPPGLFAGLGNLEWIYLDGNQLTSLPPGLFAGLTSLKHLGLSNNQLTTLPPGLFAGLGNLDLAGLFYNPGYPFPGVPTTINQNLAVKFPCPSTS